MIYLTNSFSLQMVKEDNYTLKIQKVSPSDVPEGIKSVIGHKDTAQVVSSLLKREIPFNREQISLTFGDVLFVAQFVGGRLPEGATSLPEGARIDFFKIEIAN